MKRSLLLASLSAFALTAGASAADLPRRTAAPVAPAASSGIDAFASVAAGYNWGKFSGGGESVNVDGLHLSGRATFAAPLSGAFGFQADGTIDRNVYGISSLLSEGSSDLIRTSADVAAHLFVRNKTGLLGAIVQGGVTEFNTGILSDRRFYGGLEGQYFLGNTTLYGQAVYHNANFGFLSQDVTADGYTVSGQIRHFLTPNAMIALKAGYESVEATFSDANIRHTAWLVGVKGEYRFTNVPVSSFVDIDYRDGRFNVGPIKETETRAMVGLKYNFGSTSLFDRDRNGASLDPVRPLRAIVPLVVGFGPS
jgi:hypothetical protein